MTEVKRDDVEFIWLDFEADGNNPEFCHVIEVGVIATGKNTDEEFFTIDTMVVDGDINETIATIEGNPELVKMHGDNGLLADLKLVRDGKKEAITIEELDQHLYNLVKTHNRSNHKLRISGSGVAHYDHPVIKRKMPLTASLLHFYARDIGHVRREFAEAVGHDLIDINSHKSHRAFDDITDHLNESRAFRDYFRKAELALSIVGAD